MNSRARIVTFTSVLLIIIVLNVTYVSSASCEWIPLNDNLPVPQISDLAIDPSNNHIIYALTKDAGIYKTVDGGLNWFQINKGLEESDMFSIFIDLRNPEIVFAGSFGAFKSENRGDLWTQINLELSSQVNCIKTDPSNSNIIYIGTENEGILKSIDSGNTWNSINQGLKESDFSNFPEIKTIFFDSLNTNVVYAGTDGGIFKSSDGGKNWKVINNGLTQIEKTLKETKPGIFTEVEIEVTPFVFSEAVNSSNPSNIYIGTDSGLFVTENGGETWANVSELGDLFVNKVVASKNLDKIYTGTEKGLFVSYDSGKKWQRLGQDSLDKKINGLIVDFAEPVKIYAGTDEGVFISVDGGNIFSPLNSGLVHLNISHIYSGDSYEIILVSALTDGLLKSVNSGKNWTSLKNGLENLSVISATMDPNNNQTFFVGTNDGICISKDGGETFDTSFKRLEGYEVYEILFVNAKLILAGTNHGIYKSEDEGSTWESSNSGIEEENYFACISLEVDQQKPENIYAGTVDKGIYKTENSGNSWSPMNEGLDTPIPPINVIKIDPLKSSTIYAGTEGNSLLKSENGGLTWVKIENTPSPWVKDVVIDPENTKNIYAVFYPSGIFESKDGGYTWKDINYNISPSAIVSVFFSGENLLIGTKTGIYKLHASYIITSSSSSNGTISPSGKTTVNYGDSKTFTITPSYGYKISNVKVDGKSIGLVSSYTFTNVTQDHTIEATFEKEKKETVIILQIGNKNFTVNGETRTLDSPPVIKNNRTLLPIRAVVEALGGVVNWDATERKVTITLSSTTIELWISKSTAMVNGIDTPIDATNPKVVPEIINSRTMLPLRFVAESLGCTVDWDGTTKTITIRYGG